METIKLMETSRAFPNGLRKSCSLIGCFPFQNIVYLEMIIKHKQFSFPLV